MLTASIPKFGILSSSLLGTKSKLASFMQVILLVVGHRVVSQDERKHSGGIMRLTVPSRKKNDSEKSGRKVKIKKHICKQKGRQSQLSMQLGKVHNDQQNQIFEEVCSMKSENQDIVGDKCIKDDDGNLAFDDKSKLTAWKSHYKKLLCLKNNHSKVLLFGLPSIWLAKHR